MTGAMLGVLKAVSDQARTQTANGGPDILLTAEVTLIGRNVPKAPGLPLPMTWAQVSGRHCQIIGNTNDGYKVHDTSTNGSYILRDNTAAPERVPKGGSLTIQPDDTLRLSTAPTTNPSHVLEYRLDFIADETRVRKAEDGAEAADGAMPAKRLCMSGASGTPDNGHSVQLEQLLKTNRDLGNKLTLSRGETDAARKQSDAHAAEAVRMADELAATRKQGEAAVAAAAAEAEQRCERQIQELSAAKAELTTQLEQQKEAVSAAQEKSASITADLDARQAEVQQLQEQLFNAQQGKNEELEALKVSSSGLQTQLAAAIAEASQLRVELEKSAQEAQDLRKQAQEAGEVQRQAQEAAETLRHQLTSSQQETQAALRKQEDLADNLRLARDELGVMENHLRQQVQQWANQRAQWQKLAAAQQRVNEAQAALREPERQLAQEASKLGSMVDKVAAAGQGLASPSHGGHSAAAHFEGTQQTLEVSSTSHNPLVANGVWASLPAAAGTPADCSPPAPTAAAAATAETSQQQQHTVSAPAEVDGGAMQHDSAPDAGTQLYDMPPPTGNGVGSAPTFEDGQRQDTVGLGRATGSGAADTPVNGVGSQTAADEAAADGEDASGHMSDGNDAVADADGGAAPAAASSVAAAKQPSSGSKPAAEEDEDEEEEDDGEGEAAGQQEDDRDEDDDEVMEVKV